MRRIKVLVVNNSPIMRDLIISEIKGDPSLEVVAAVRDPVEARDAILKYDPNVMLLEVNLPRMNGLEFLRILMPQYPVATVVTGNSDSQGVEARKAGAVEFVKNPSTMEERQIRAFVRQELIIKLKLASAVRVGSLKKVSAQPKTDAAAPKDPVIAIGASTGGTEAIFDVVKNFSRNMPGIIITQHMPRGFTKMYAERLNEQCRMACKEAETGDRVVPGQMLLAPGDVHLRLVKVNGMYQVECKGSQKVNGHCPSVDVMFDSVAKCAGRNAVGILLTGMGADGAKGLLAMRQAGAVTIGQDEASSIVYGMPKVAYDIGAVKYQVSLKNIPGKISSVLGRQ